MLYGLNENVVDFCHNTHGDEENEKICNVLFNIIKHCVFSVDIYTAMRLRNRYPFEQAIETNIQSYSY